MEINLEPFTLIGILLMILGALFVLAPFITRYIGLENIPSWVLYVYKGKNFYFVTSPLLIVISLIIIIWQLII